MNTQRAAPANPPFAAASVGRQRREDTVPSDGNELPLADIEAAIRGIRYGVVQIIIQDGVVVQIDKTEKSRLR